MSLNLDKSTWKRVAFGDVVQNVNVTIRDPESAGIDRVIAMEHMDPGELKIRRWGSCDDGTTFTRLVKPGQTLFGKRRAYQRKVSYAEFDAICSGDILTFEADKAQLLPELLPFLVQSNEFFDHALDTSAGSLSPRTSWRDLATFEFDLPQPLEEQKRIADLLWSLERHRLATGALAEALRETQVRLSSRRLASLPGAARLGDLATTRSGPSFAASDVHSTPVTGSVPIIGIPNTKPEGSIDLTDVGHVAGLPGSVWKIDDSSLVLIRTNGNRNRIGNVYLPPVQAHGYAVSAFQFLMQVNNAADRDYLFWVLVESGMQERMSREASGTVGLGNLAVTWLNDQEIPWSDDPAERQAVVEELQHLAAVIDMNSLELAALTSLRSSLLIEIFGGN